MGPLFINQRRSSKSVCLEGEEGDTPTTSAIIVQTRNNEEGVDHPLNANIEPLQKDIRRTNNGPAQPPTAITTINVNVTPANNAQHSKPNMSNGNKSHVRSSSTSATNAAIGSSKLREETSSTEDLSNNEEFPWIKKRNLMMKKNKPSNNGGGGGGSNNAEMNPGQFHMMSNPQGNQESQQARLLRKSQSNLQIANGGGGGFGVVNPHHPNSAKNGTISGGNHPFNGTGPNVSNVNNNGANNGNGLKKYLVLLQDCLAIKFIAAGQPHHSQHFHFAFNSSDCWSNKDNVNNSQINGATTTGGGGGMESSTAEVDHSLHGLYLYKGFREANLKCYWNSTLCEAIQNLDFKGYIVPSTILVFALPRFLSVLRTAWSRKMLRYPPGYKVDFVGEIEEFIAEPIPQGQFAPLSDSLCWAILELTSSSQEAFVDSILFALSTAFPSMTLPSKELVYQTLEKLIKDRKIYQTSHGYFVVTPDTFRYMNSGGDSWSHFNSQSSATLPLDALMTSFYESDRVSLSGRSWGSAGSGNMNGDDFLITSSGLRTSHSHLKRHNSLKVIRQRDLDLLGPTMGSRSLSFRLAKPKSVFDSDRDDKYSSSRSKSSTMDSNTEGSSPGSKDITTSEDETGRKTSKDKSKPRKRSFFRRWFSFRKSTKVKAKNPEVGKVALESLPRSPKTYSSISRLRQSHGSVNSNAATQTATRSYENMNDYIEHLDLSNENEHLYLPMSKHISKWNSLPSAGTRNRSRSRRSILNDSPFYDTLTYKPEHITTASGDMKTNINSKDPRYSKRSVASSSLGYGSQGTYPQRGVNSTTYDQLQTPTSIGTSGNVVTGRIVDRQKQRHLSASNGTSISKSARIDSPCPSVSTSAIYASIANSTTPPACTTSEFPGNVRNGSNVDSVYRRRHPSQTSQSQNRFTSRPKSAYELLAYQNMMYQQNQKKSIDSLMPQMNHHKSKSSLSSKSHQQKPVVSTTTITQKVRSTTNTDLDLLLPLGAVSKGMACPEVTIGLNNNVHDIMADEEEAIKLRVGAKPMDNVKIDVESVPNKLRTNGMPVTTTQVTTTTVNNNGTVETHFSSSDCSNNPDDGLVENCNCNKDSDVSH